MRIYLHLTPNTEPVPFNYQRPLVGAFHRWLGENELHDDISLYSLSWLQGGRTTKDGITFPEGATFFISSPLPELNQALVTGILDAGHVRWGMRVKEATLAPAPKFGTEERFVAQSPILIKRNRPDGKGQQYYFPWDEMANTFLTETLHAKLTRAGLDTAGVSVRFDANYASPKTKLVSYRDLKIRATFCPVIITGSPEAIAFAWQVGVGNSTGIGFGALG